ncbi:MAG: flagellin [Clostridia bacterium]|nr:flagellin [Clostridia bacterium]
MRINNNIMALNTYNQMTTNDSKAASSIEKLSSGYAINSAADNAAGLAISEKMRSQIRGLDQASSNAQDGISMIQTAEGALDETETILQRMRELSVQSSNDTYTAEDRQAIQDEIEQLTSEINRISTDTEFNNKSLLDGSLENQVDVDTNAAKISKISVDDPKFAAGDYTITTSAITFGYAVGDVNQTGVSAVAVETANTDAENIAPGEYTLELTETGDENTFDVTLTDADGNEVATLENQTIASGGNIDIGGINVTFAADAEAGRSDIVVDVTATFALSDDGGATTLTSKTVTNSTESTVSLGGLELEINDTLDAAGGTATISTNNNSVTFQIGANSGQTTDMTISDMSAHALGVDELDLTTSEGATSAIDILDDAINAVSSERSKLGAMQNRLEHTIENLTTSSENLTSAESRIRDVDMAKEMMEMTKWTTLQQSATAMMAQANAQPEQVLSLLR